MEHSMTLYGLETDEDNAYSPAGDDQMAESVSADTSVVGVSQSQ